MLEVGQASAKLWKSISFDSSVVIFVNRYYLTLIVALGNCALPRTGIFRIGELHLIRSEQFQQKAVLSSFRLIIYHMHPFRLCTSDVCDPSRDAEVGYFLLNLTNTFAHATLEPLPVSVLQVNIF